MAGGEALPVVLLLLLLLLCIRLQLGTETSRAGGGDADDDAARKIDGVERARAWGREAAEKQP